MKSLKLIFASISLLAAAGASAQTTLEEMSLTPEKCGGVYYAYPVTESHNTPVPKGYEPFYVSHYGRHGSRFLISDTDYERVLVTLRKADEAKALTPLGEKVLEVMQEAWAEGEGRSGELTPLGYRQHRAIAERLATNYPEIFKGNPEITARSTQVMRCAHSMFSFVSGLMAHFPDIKPEMESSKRHMIYLCHSEPVSWDFNDNKLDEWRPEYIKFRAKMTNPDRLCSALFNSEEYIKRHINPDELMWELYWVAVDLQNMETDRELLSIFTPEELFNLWRVFNAQFYINNSSYPRSQGVNVDNARNLLNNIITTADEYVASGQNGATLRFGHDGNIVPLAAMMRIPGTYGYTNDIDSIHTVWNDWRVAPMAANLQIIFFRNKKGDVIAKAMLNEDEIDFGIEGYKAPYYPWPVLRQYLQNLADTPSRNFMPEEFRN